MPFWVGGGAVVLAVLMLTYGRRCLRGVDEGPGHGVEAHASPAEAEVLTAADA